MDKIKKYFTENEQNLSVEEVDEHVWLSIQSRLKPASQSKKASILTGQQFRWHLKAMMNTVSKYFRPSTEQKGWFRSKPRIVILLCLPLLIFSCIYRVDTHVVVGDFMSFDVKKAAEPILQQAIQAKPLENIRLLQYNKPSAEDQVSFVSYLERKDSKIVLVSNALKAIPVVTNLETLPVSALSNASLLSAVVYKLLRVQIDMQQPAASELQKSLLSALTEKGILGINVTVSHQGEVQLSRATHIPTAYDDTMGIHHPDTSNTIEKSPVPITHSADPNKVAIQSEPDTILQTEQRTKPGLIPANDIALSRADEKWLHSSLPAGSWKGVIHGNEISIYFSDPQPDPQQFSGWRVTRKFSLKETGLEQPRGKSSFSIKRAAGVVSFEGNFNETRGEGLYVFDESKDFRSFLEKNDFKNVDTDLTLHMFLTNINEEYLAYLKNNGYAKVSSDELRRLATHFVRLDYLQDLTSYLKDHNYENISIARLIKLRDIGVTTAYLQAFQELGYGNLPLNRAESLINEGVRPAVVRQFMEMGYGKISLDVVEKLATHNTGPAFISGLEELGYKQVSLDMVLQLRYQGVDIPLIKEFQQLGLKALSLDDIRQMRSYDVTPRFIQQMIKNGKRGLSAQEYIRLKQYN